MFLVLLHCRSTDKNNAATSGRKSSVSGGFGLTGMTGVVEGRIKPFIRFDPAGARHRLAITVKLPRGSQGVFLISNHIIPECR